MGAFHTYSWRTFMHNEFCCRNDMFEGPYQSGEDVLELYEIDDVNPGTDMVILAVYALIIHIISLGVLYLRYNAFRGQIKPPRKNFVLSNKTFTQMEQAAPPTPVQQFHLPPPNAYTGEESDSAEC